MATPRVLSEFERFKLAGETLGDFIRRRQRKAEDIIPPHSLRLLRRRLGLDKPHTRETEGELGREIAEVRGGPRSASERRVRTKAQLPTPQMVKDVEKAARRAGFTTEGGSPIPIHKEEAIRLERREGESFTQYLDRIEEIEEKDDFRIPVDPTLAVLRGVAAPPTPRTRIQDDETFANIVAKLGRLRWKEPDVPTPQIKIFGQPGHVVSTPATLGPAAVTPSIQTPSIQPAGVPTPQVDVLGGPTITTTLPGIRPPGQGRQAGQSFTDRITDIFGLRSALSNADRRAAEFLDTKSRDAVSFLGRKTLDVLGKGIEVATPAFEALPDPVKETFTDEFMVAANFLAEGSLVNATLYADKLRPVGRRIPTSIKETALVGPFLEEFLQGITSEEGMERARQSREQFHIAFDNMFSSNRTVVEEAARAISEIHEARPIKEQILGGILSPEILIPGGIARKGVKAYQAAKQAKEAALIARAGLPPTAIQRALPPGRPPAAAAPIQPPGTIPLGPGAPSPQQLALPPGLTDPSLIAPVTPAARVADVPAARVGADVPVPAVTRASGIVNERRAVQEIRTKYQPRIEAAFEAEDSKPYDALRARREAEEAAVSPTMAREQVLQKERGEILLGGKTFHPTEGKVWEHRLSSIDDELRKLRPQVEYISGFTDTPPTPATLVPTRPGAAPAARVAALTPDEVTELGRLKVQLALDEESLAAGMKTGLASLIPEGQSMMGLRKAFQAAKARGLVKTEADFRELLEAEIRAGTIDGGSGTSSRMASNSKLGHEYVDNNLVLITGYIERPSGNTLIGNIKRAQKEIAELEARQVAEVVPTAPTRAADVPTPLGPGAPAPQRFALPPGTTTPPPTTAPIRPVVRSGPSGDPIPLPGNTAPYGESTVMTQEASEEALNWFARYIESPESVRAWDLTKKFRAEAMAGRSARLQERARELIEGGTPIEEAIDRATRESLSGTLPLVTQDFFQLYNVIVTTEVRDALFARVYQVLADEPLEMAQTATALRNALLGRPIPRTPGIAGGSAFTRLSRVFPPEIMRGLDTGKKLEDTLKLRSTPEGISDVTRRFAASIPRRGLRQQQGELIPKTAPWFDRPSPGPLIPEGVPTPKKAKPTDPRIAAQRELDLRLALSEPPTRPSGEGAGALTGLDDVIERQIDLMPQKVKDRWVGILRETGLTIRDVGLFMRANVASGDLGFWRQMSLMLFRRPDYFILANLDAFKALFSDDTARALDKAIISDPDYHIYKEIVDRTGGGDFLRPLNPDKDVPAWHRSEAFQLQGENRPIARFAERVPWIRISARAQITGTNSLGWRSFKRHMRALHKEEEAIAAGIVRLDPGEAYSISQRAEPIMNMIADMSGRANLGPLKSLSPALNSGFFSARLQLGRAIWWKHLFRGPAHKKKLAWEYFGSAMAGWGSIIYLGKEMGLWDVEGDPRSSDFGKIILAGRTRIDPFGGAQQYFVLYLRLILSMAQQDNLKRTTTGEVVQVDPVELIENTLRNKITPAASQALMLWTDKDFKGSDVDRLSIRTWLKENMLLVTGDMLDGFEAYGEEGLGLGIVSFTGIGVGTYDLPRWPELDEYYRLDTDEFGTAADRRRAYRKMYPEAEAKLFVRGAILTHSRAAEPHIIKLLKDLGLEYEDVRGLKKLEETGRSTRR